jgi:uncharacterized membrane protein
MRSPFSLLPLLLFLLAIGLLVALVQIGIVTIAFEKLGLSAASAYLLLFGSLFGSAFNLPLFEIVARPNSEARIVPAPWHRLVRPSPRPFTGRTLVALNVGGGLMPAAFSLYLIGHNPLAAWEVVAAIAVVMLVSRLLSRPIPGVGVGMPIFIAPLCAALTAVIINPEQSAPLAYISGTLGVLIGADLLRLDDIRRMGTPFASIGGAGTFDGIFLTGFVAVLLA